MPGEKIPEFLKPHAEARRATVFTQDAETHRLEAAGGLVIFQTSRQGESDVRAYTRLHTGTSYLRRDLLDGRAVDDREPARAGTGRSRTSEGAVFGRGAPTI